MKKKFIFTLALLVSIAGCKRPGFLQRKQYNTVKPRYEEERELTSASRSSFDTTDQDIDEFTADIMDNFRADSSEVVAQADEKDSCQTYSMDTLSWEQEKRDNDFKPVYFGFNSSEIAENQKDVVAYNVNSALDIVQEYEALGDANPTFVIEGHADHAAGSQEYNKVISEKRAQTLKAEFVKAGIDESNIKVIARGAEMPAVIDGKIVDGNREEQCANRRDEVYLINA